MIFLKLILTNLLRHRIRSLISIAGIAFSVAAMLTIVTILQGAVGMFSGILSSDSQVIVFERNVSDLFFSNVPASALAEISSWSMVQHADPVLFGVVSSSDHPIITCFGITAADARLRKATWLEGSRANFAHEPNDVVLGQRAAEFLHAHLNSSVAIGHGTFHVAGIIQTANGFEDGGVFMPLAAAQDFFHKPGASSVITIKLTDKKFADDFKQRVKEKFPDLIALEDAEFTRSYSQFKILKATAWAVGGCGLHPRRPRRRQHHDHVGLHAHPRDRHPPRQRLLQCPDRHHDLRRVRARLRLRRHRRPAARRRSSLASSSSFPRSTATSTSAIQPLVVLIVIVLAFLTGVAGALYPAIYAMRIRAVEALRFE